MKIRTYTELLTYNDYDSRLRYLKLNGSVGLETFGYERWLNQRLYSSREWRQLRDYIIVRDNGFDMGLKEHPISGKVIVHHMNPITVDDISDASEMVFNPEYLICVSLDTHNLIHYGYVNSKDMASIERLPNDTCEWRNK